jgi:hypothetical protein
LVPAGKGFVIDETATVPDTGCVAGKLDTLTLPILFVPAGNGSTILLTSTTPEIGPGGPAPVITTGIGCKFVPS